MWKQCRFYNMHYTSTFFVSFCFVLFCLFCFCFLLLLLLLLLLLFLFICFFFLLGGLFLIFCFCLVFCLFQYVMTQNLYAKLLNSFANPLNHEQRYALFVIFCSAFCVIYFKSNITVICQITLIFFKKT